jgi:hypothetical protein
VQGVVQPLRLQLTIRPRGRPRKQQADALAGGEKKMRAFSLPGLNIVDWLSGKVHSQRAIPGKRWGHCLPDVRPGDETGQVTDWDGEIERSGSHALNHHADYLAVHVQHRSPRTAGIDPCSHLDPIQHTPLPAQGGGSLRMPFACGSGIRRWWQAVREGTRVAKSALPYPISASTAVGLPRTNADKRKAVAELLPRRRDAQERAVKV